MKNELKNLLVRKSLAHWLLPFEFEETFLVEEEEFGSLQ
jgi:hypothetical protein